MKYEREQGKTFSGSSSYLLFSQFHVKNNGVYRKGGGLAEKLL
jgi:hypothetical protein